MTTRGIKYKEAREKKRIKRAFMIGGGIVLLFAILFFAVRPRKKAKLTTDLHKKWHSEVTRQVGCIANEIGEKYSDDSLLIQRVNGLEGLVRGFNTNTNSKNKILVENEIIQLKKRIIDEGSSDDFCE